MRPLPRAAVCLLVAIGLQAGESRACTSFCMETPDGPIYGTNLDLNFDEGLLFVNPRGLAKTGTRANTAGEKPSWVVEYGSVTFNLVGREFPLSWDLDRHGSIEFGIASLPHGAKTAQTKAFG